METKENLRVKGVLNIPIAKYHPLYCTAKPAVTDGIEEGRGERRETETPRSARSIESTVTTQEAILGLFAAFLVINPAGNGGNRAPGAFWRAGSWSSLPCQLEVHMLRFERNIIAPSKMVMKEGGEGSISPYTWKGAHQSGVT
jgi:hypothetical protein